jgi:DNA-binding NarL/FixJ family response regulator
MTVLALISDLMMQSQVSAAGERVGTTVQTVSTADSLLSAAETTDTRLVILDLSHPGLQVSELLAKLKVVRPAAAIIAFGPHVHKDRLAAAEAAGCTAVMSRGQFHATIDQVVAGH